MTHCRKCRCSPCTCKMPSAAFLRENSSKAALASVFPKPISKYHVSAPEERTHDKIVYASKAEMLAAKQFADDPTVLWYCRQPQFMLAGGVSLRVDFLVCREVFTAGGLASAIDIEAIEIKGVETPDFKIKKRLWANTPGLPPLRIVWRGKTVEVITPPQQSSRDMP